MERWYIWGYGSPGEYLRRLLNDAQCRVIDSNRAMEYADKNGIFGTPEERQELFDRDAGSFREWAIRMAWCGDEFDGYPVERILQCDPAVITYSGSLK
jgi:hypothetical protein